MTSIEFSRSLRRWSVHPRNRLFLRKLQIAPRADVSMRYRRNVEADVSFDSEFRRKRRPIHRAEADVPAKRSKSRSMHAGRMIANQVVLLGHAMLRCHRSLVGKARLSWPRLLAALLGRWEYFGVGEFRASAISSSVIFNLRNTSAASTSGSLRICSTSSGDGVSNSFTFSHSPLSIMRANSARVGVSTCPFACALSIGMIHLVSICRRNLSLFQLCPRWRTYSTSKITTNVPARSPPAARRATPC